MRLDEIAQSWDAWEAAVLNSDGEVSPELASQHDALELAERQKVDGLSIYVKSLEQQALGLKALEDELAAKRGVIERRVKWLKGYAQQYLEQRGLTEVRGDVFRLCLQKNGGAPPVELLKPVESLPEWACRVTRAPNMEVIRQSLLDQSLKAQEFAKLAAPGTHLRIR